MVKISYLPTEVVRRCLDRLFDEPYPLDRLREFYALRLTSSSIRDYAHERAPVLHRGVANRIAAHHLQKGAGEEEVEAAPTLLNARALSLTLGRPTKGGPADSNCAVKAVNAILVRCASLEKLSLHIEPRQGGDNEAYLPCCLNNLSVLRWAEAGNLRTVRVEFGAVDSPNSPLSASSWPPRLTSLSLWELKFTPEAASGIGAIIEQIHDLRITHCRLGLALVELLRLPNATTLESLALSENASWHGALDELQFSVNNAVKSLDLSCNGLDDATRLGALLQTLPLLEKLNLAGNYFTSLELELDALPCLTSLNLPTLHHTPTYHDYASLVHQVRGCPTLKSLDLDITGLFGRPDDLAVTCFLQTSLEMIAFYCVNREADMEEGVRRLLTTNSKLVSRPFTYHCERFGPLATFTRHGSTGPFLVELFREAGEPEEGEHEVDFAMYAAPWSDDEDEEEEE